MKILSGMISGFIATVVLSFIMLMKDQMGIMPELNAIRMMANMMGTGLAMGWIAHFMIGTVLWGALFALVEDRLPGNTLMSGVVFAVAAWLLMMIGPMPMSGAGLFGMAFGIMAPMATLMMHVIWGLALAFAFERLGPLVPNKD